MTTDELLTEKEYIIRRVLHIHFRVHHICEKYRIEMDDLMQVGRIGLWEASEKFRPKENGLSFDTYAHRIINYKLLEYLRYLRRPIRQVDYGLSLHVEIAEGVEWLDAISSHENIEVRILDRLYFETMISSFNSHEKSIFQQRMAGYSYAEIEKTLGITRRKLSNIRAEIVEKIKTTRWNGPLERTMY